MAKLRIKRAYEPADPEDGARILVDRLWPRGVSREKLKLTDWQKYVAPSDDLRTWFGHDPDRWEEFRRRYFAELDANRKAMEPLRDALKEGTVTLVYGAKDEEHNNAVALRDYLEHAKSRAEKD